MAIEGEIGLKYSRASYFNLKTLFVLIDDWRTLEQIKTYRINEM